MKFPNFPEDHSKRNRCFISNNTRFRSPAGSMSHISPIRTLLELVVLSIILENIIVSTSAQRYLSTCTTSTSTTSTSLCAPEQFLKCQSGQCLCEDPLNQVYDFDKAQCVIMAGRKCGVSVSDLVDPRKLPAVELKPQCGSHASCETTSSTCQCAKGYVLNGQNGTCDQNFGRACSLEDSIVFNSSDNSSSSKTTLKECETSLGLGCGSDGFCKCNETSVWHSEQGCILVSANGNSSLAEPAHDYNHAYSNPDDMNPFQKLVDTYTKALIEANNYFYSNEADDNRKVMKNGESTTSSGDSNQTSSNLTRSAGDFVGNRYEFPLLASGSSNNQNVNHLQHNDPWELLLQQQLQQQSNNQHLYTGNNNTPGHNADINNLLALQEQATQLQNLLLQQQQLQQILDQITAAGQQSPGKPSATTNPLAMSLSMLENLVPLNFLGVQNNRNTPQQNPALQQQGLRHEEEARDRDQLPLLRFYRTMKRRLFPNLSELFATFPSPIYVAAATMQRILPVLRTIDHQYSPFLDRLVRMTKPRARPMTTPTPAPYVTNFLPYQGLWNGFFRANSHPNMFSVRRQNNQYRHQPFGLTSIWPRMMQHRRLQGQNRGIPKNDNLRGRDGRKMKDQGGEMNNGFTKGNECACIFPR